MEKTTVVEWYDPDTADTCMIAAQAYGVKICDRQPTGSLNELQVTVSGPAENVDRFAEDVEEGDVEPFDVMTREMSDCEYQIWLKDELAKFGCLYIPAYSEEDSSDEEN